MIFRQHSKTEIPELVGAVADRIVIVIDPMHNDSANVCYLLVGQKWHHAVVFHGILYWEEEEPEPGNDIGMGEEYVDVGARYGLNGARIRYVRIADNRFVVGLGETAELRFVYEPDGDWVRFEIGENPPPGQASGG